MIKDCLQGNCCRQISFKLQLTKISETKNENNGLNYLVR